MRVVIDAPDEFPVDVRRGVCVDKRVVDEPGGGKPVEIVRKLRHHVWPVGEVIVDFAEQRFGAGHAGAGLEIVRMPCVHAQVVPVHDGFRESCV